MKLNFSNKLNLSQSLVRLSSLALLTSLSVLVIPGAIAQSIPNEWQPANYKPPAGVGRPDNTETGGTRSLNPDIAVTSMIPQQVRFGVTVNPDPNIYISIPALNNPNQNRVIYFELVDQNQDVVYYTEMETPGEAGLVRIPVPETHPETQKPLMTANEDYYWLVSVYDESQDVVGLADGWIRFVPTPDNLAAQLAAETSLLAQAELLAAEGVWYTAFDKLAMAYHNNPNDAQIQAAWEKLLKVAGLENLTQSVTLNPSMTTSQVEE